MMLIQYVGECVGLAVGELEWCLMERGSIV